jgi:large subunit ribosomal protein L1
MAKKETGEFAKMPKRHRDNMKMRTEEHMKAGDAVSKLKQYKPAKFDQTVEVVMHLGIDAKQADQAVRGSVALPAGIGKAKKVVAFCTADLEKDAMAAGAIKAGSEDLVREIEGGWMDFDVAVATPDMMRVISKLGRVLGPKGLMPSPKSGSVTKDVVAAVKEFAAGKVEYRNDKSGNIHAPIGKMSFKEDDLKANLETFIGVIEKARPSAVKGIYIKKIAISGTMTPSVLVETPAETHD